MEDEEVRDPEISEYDKKATIVLNPGGRWPFSFGLAKAKLIVTHFEKIKRFVETNGTSLE